jgi:ATP-dependent RNA helicase RhlE
MQVLSKNLRSQSGENKRKPAAQRAVAAGKGTSLSSGSPFSVQKATQQTRQQASGGFT